MPGIHQIPALFNHIYYQTTHIILCQVPSKLILLETSVRERVLVELDTTLSVEESIPVRAQLQTLLVVNFRLTKLTIVDNASVRRTGVNSHLCKINIYVYMCMY